MKEIMCLMRQSSSLWETELGNYGIIIAGFRGRVPKKI